MADRMSDHDVEQRLAALDGLLGRLEQIPGATAALGLDAVRALTEVYGEALARLMTLLASSPSARQAAAADDLIGHLLILHGLHPQPPSERITRALEAIRPALASHGSDAQLAGITDGIAQIQLTSAGCSSSASTLELAVREAVLAAAPGLRDVQFVYAASAETLPLIPVSQMRRRPQSHPAGQSLPPSGGAG
jgi:Fe-S cluster biogenesis protein NfuA